MRSCNLFLVNYYAINGNSVIRNEPERIIILNNVFLISTSKNSKHNFRLI